MSGFLVAMLLSIPVGGTMAACTPVNKEALTDADPGQRGGALSFTHSMYGIFT